LCLSGVPLAEEGRYLGTAKSWGVHATTAVNLTMPLAGLSSMETGGHDIPR
jgi:hypothetical protein